MQECLGVDLGNVIIDHVGFGTTSEFFRNGDYNVIPPVPEVFDVLRELHGKRFGDNMFVVYNATDIADQKIISWLEAHDFFNRTGIPKLQMKRTRNGRNKWSVCELYKITHFVDDRLEVLSHLVGKVDNLYLFRPQAHEVEQFQEFLPHVTQVQTWREILRLMIP